MRLRSQHACFGGTQSFYEHDAAQIGLPMRFGVYLPPHAVKAGGGNTQAAPLPALVFLAGLTCTEETFAIKAGAQALAAELGLALITPDTSPRGAGVPGEAEAWDFGVGASFYLDATQAPWATHWRVESWLVQELLPLLGASLPIDLQRLALTGHSMGGHGALTLGLRHPALFRSVSAIAPVVAPSEVPWGIKAFTGYLGPDRSTWGPHDACALIAQAPSAPWPQGLLVDQGEADPFLAEQLQPERLEAACAAAGQPLTLRRHPGYDHGYYFVQSVVGEHLRWHARALGLA